MTGNRGPTPTQRPPKDPQPPDGVEVVTADQLKADAAKQPSPFQRAKTRIGEAFSGSDADGLATWPAQLDDDQTVVTGNPAVQPQPPRATLVAYRQQHKSNVARVADQADRRVAQLVVLDEHGRSRVYDIARLTALQALWNEATAQLQADGWALVAPTLIGEFAAEIDGWRADRGIAP